MLHYENDDQRDTPNKFYEHPVFAPMSGLGSDRRGDTNLCVN
jgi:hypothetical protein